MGRDPVETTFGGVRIIVEPLPFPQARALLPDVAQTVSLVFEKLGTAVASGKLKLSMDSLEDPKVIAMLMPMLGVIGEHMSEGRLERYTRGLLASTVVCVTNLKGDLEKKQLNSEAALTEVFDEHPSLYIPVLVFAGAVTYQRFFPGSGPPAK